jgi:hypothetical protein
VGRRNVILTGATKGDETMAEPELYISDLPDSLIAGASARTGSATLAEEVGPTTLAIGEEGDDDPTTLAIGEEGDDPTTLAIGEEGEEGPTTKAIGEEGNDDY